MGAPSVTVRCPNCRADLRVVLAPAPPTQWFPCPNCHSPVPVVVPRDPPPLYSWEVLPGLYPALPSPRRPRVPLRRMAQLTLVGIAVVSVVLTGLLVAYGAEALGTGTYSVSGTVFLQSGNGVAPAAGTTVTLTTDSGETLTQQTSLAGAFAFGSVPAGGIALNFTAAGYSPETVYTFASPVYNAGTTGLSVTLQPGPESNGSATALTPFPDLESFLASIGSAAVLLGIVASIGVAAAVVTARSDRPAVGVVGGAAGLLSPFALYFLALGDIFPAVLAGTAVLAGLGAFVTTTRSIEIFQIGPEDRSTKS